MNIFKRNLMISMPVALFLAIAALFEVPAGWHVSWYPAEVVRVIDGDTVDCMIVLADRVNIREKVRLAKIDAPERGKRGYNEASMYLATRVLNKKITLVVVERDGSKEWQRGHYGRVIGRILVDNADVGQEMLEKGLVKEYGN